jgi:hypothetical protein
MITEAKAVEEGASRSKRLTYWMKEDRNPFAGEVIIK